MTEFYRCDKCLSMYKTPEDAVLCELKHQGWNDDLANIISLALDPCYYCKNAYYVYGCEFDCKFIKECNFTSKYKNFERKNKDE